MKNHEYRLDYRADVEGLRAIAILLVVAMHAGFPWLPGGFVGVDVFFVLSGFLITGLLLKEISETGQLRFLEFYVRRLRRLLPALLAMLLVVGFLASVLLVPIEQKAQSSAAAMAAVWLSNIYFALGQLDYFQPGTETNLFLHTWSLGVEEQFYLIWPALLIWLLGRGKESGLVRVKAGMIAVSITSLVFCIWCTYAAPQLAFYMMPLRAWQFSTGALVWLYCNQSNQRLLQNKWQQIYLAIGWAGLALIILSGTMLSSNIPYPGAYAILPTLGGLGIIISGSTGSLKTGVSRLLAIKPLQFIGRISYSWYLWHWPILLLGLPIPGADSSWYRLILILISLLLAILSYHFIETPVRQQNSLLKRPGITALSALALMFVVNNVSLFWHDMANEQAQSPSLHCYNIARLDTPIIYRIGCDGLYYDVQMRVCELGAPNAQHTVVLIGDSHAGQWAPTVADVFSRPEWRVLVITKSACPMVDEPYFYTRIGKYYKVCTEWRNNVLRYISKIHPDITLFGSSGTVDFTQSQWLDGTTKVLDILSAASDWVYLLRDTPSLPFDGPNCLAKYSIRPTFNLLHHTCSAPAYNAYKNNVYGWRKLIVNNFTNARILDMNEFICPMDQCMAEQNGIIVYRDSQHLTRSFARSLAVEMAKKLGLSQDNTKKSRKIINWRLQKYKSGFE